MFNRVHLVPLLLLLTLLTFPYTFSSIDKKLSNGVNFDGIEQNFTKDIGSPLPNKRDFQNSIGFLSPLLYQQDFPYRTVLNASLSRIVLNISLKYLYYDSFDGSNVIFFGHNGSNYIYFYNSSGSPQFNIFLGGFIADGYVLDDFSQSAGYEAIFASLKTFLTFYIFYWDSRTVVEIGSVNINGNATIFPIDFDGDGLKDVGCIVSNKTLIFLTISGGYLENVGNITAPGNISSYIVGDFDGDRLEEVALLIKLSTHWEIWFVGYSNGIKLLDIANISTIDKVFIDKFNYDGDSVDEILFSYENLTTNILNITIYNIVNGTIFSNTYDLSTFSSGIISEEFQVIFDYLGDGLDDILIVLLDYNIVYGNWSYKFILFENPLFSSPTQILVKDFLNSISVDDFNWDGSDELGICWNQTSKTFLEIFNSSIQKIFSYNYSFGDYKLDSFVDIRDGYYKKFLLRSASGNNFVLVRKTSVKFDFYLKDPAVSGLYNMDINELNLVWKTITYSGVFLNLSIYLNESISSSNLPKSGNYTISVSTEALYRISLRIEYEDFGIGELYFYAIYDKTIPNVVDFSPKNGSYLNYTLVNISWVAWDNVAVSQVNVSIDYSETYTFSTKSGSLQYNFTEGMHRVNVTVIDLAGNVNSSEYLLFVDLTKPSISILEPSSDIAYTNGSIVIKWTGYDDPFGGEIVYKIYSNKTNILNTTNNWFEFSPTVEGKYLLEIYAIDLAGNTNSDNLTIVFDKTPPTIQILKPQNRSYTNNQEIQLEWVVSDENIGEVKLFLQNGTNVLLNPSGSLVIYLQSGENIFSIEAIDKAGNRAVSKIVVYLDTDAPKIEISSPKNNSVYGSENVSVAWSSWDNYGISNTTIYLNGSKINLGNGENLTVSMDGLYNLTIVVTDLAGNKNSTTILFEIDTRPPTISVLVPKNGSRLGGEFTLKWVLEEKHFSMLKVKLNGSIIALVLENNYTDTLNISVLVEGKIFLEISATDKLNNTAKVLVVVYVDLTPIKFTIIEPKNSTFTNNLSLQIKINYSNISDFERLKIYVNGTLILNLSTPQEIILIDLLGDGENILKIETLDQVGNSYYSEIAIYVDLTPPNIKANYNKFSNKTTESLNLTISDNMKLSKVLIFRNNTLYKQLPNASEHMTIILELLEGNNTFLIKVFDAANNTASINIWIYCDLEAPKILLYEPANNTYTRNSTITIRFLVIENGSGIDFVEVYRNGEIIYRRRGGKSNTSIIADIFEGVNILEIRAKDLAGNIVMVKIVVFRDTAKPKIFIENPKNGTYTNGSVNIVAKISEANLLKIEITYGEKSITFKGNISIINVTVNLIQEGENLIKILAVDMAGNKNLVKIIVINDITQPKIDYKVDRNVLTLGENLTVEINATDNYGLEKIVIEVDGDKFGEYWRGNIAIQIKFNEVGEHVVKIVAYDKAGNKSTAIILIKVVKKQGENQPTIILTPIMGFIAGIATYIAIQKIKEKT